MVVLDTEQEVHVDNERYIFTLRSEAERGAWVIEEEGTHVYTCDTKLEDTRVEDEKLEDGALNDAELDDADLTHIYTHVSELAEDAADAKDEELADGDDSDRDDSDELDECMNVDLTQAIVNNSDKNNDEVENNKLVEVMDANLTPTRISELENNDMPDDLMRAKRYLSILRRLDGITDRAFGALRRYATEFLIHEGLLFQRSKLNLPPRRVIWDKNEQTSIIQQMHDESGYRGKKRTYEKIA